MVIRGGLTKIAEKRGEAKCKRERERYTQWNAEFQRIARTDERDFFSEQCKKTEENNGIGKTRNLFKKTGDTKGTFHAKMGTTKERGRLRKEINMEKKYEEVKRQEKLGKIRNDRKFPHDMEA